MNSCQTQNFELMKGGGTQRNMAQRKEGGGTCSNVNLHCSTYGSWYQPCEARSACKKGSLLIRNMAEGHMKPGI